MKTIIPLASLINLIFLFTALSFAQEKSFDDFLNAAEQDLAQQNQEFDQYLEKIQKEFEEYQRIVEEEYAKYRKELLKHWPEAELSDAKKWVEYSPDLKTKRVVDFEEGTIKIEIITDKEGNVDQKQFGRILADMLLEDKKTAFERDTLANRIEKKVVDKVEDVKTDQVKQEPILATAVMGVPEPTKEEVISTVADLIKKATIDEKPAKNKRTQITVSLKVALPSNAMQRKAEQYRPTIDSHAEKQDIDASLALAIIHTESAFNPMATSHVPAYGLMQIVPKSAGMDATAYLFGKPELLAPSYLYNDENNIAIGTAYLHILFHRYLKSIDNFESRFYCSIAAYNTGSGNVARAFVGSKNIAEAIKKINQMTPNNVYSTLRGHLPYEETREYVKKVSERVLAYRN